MLIEGTHEPGQIVQSPPVNFGKRLDLGNLRLAHLRP